MLSQVLTAPPVRVAALPHDFGGCVEALPHDVLCLCVLIRIGALVIGPC